MSKVLTRNLSLFVLIFIFFSCGAIRPAPSEENLHDRVDKFWKAKIEGDRETIYRMISKSYREEVELKKFLKAPLLEVSSYSIENIELDPPEAVATVDYRFSNMGFDFDTVSKEKWVFEDGNWFLHMKPAGGMPF